MKKRAGILVFLIGVFIFLAWYLPRVETPAAPHTPSVGDQQACAFVWASRPLPELSAAIDRALKNAGLPNAKVRAEAYGEDCINEQGEIVYFAAMQTDLYFTLRANDLKDEEELGRLLDIVLDTVREFPPGETPGPNPGYIGITYHSKGQERRLWFALSEALQAQAEGLSGIELFQKLHHP